MKKLFLSLLTMSILTTSCSQDETSDKKLNTTQQSQKIVDESAIKNFAIKHVSISREILNLFKESEPNLKFTEKSYEEVLNLKTEDDLKNYFNEKGLGDSSKFIYLLKNLQTNYFLINDKIKNLTLDEQKSIISNAIDKEMNIDLTVASKPNCASQYQTDISRCERNQVIGLGFSWLGGVLTGGVGGLLGAAASSTAYHFCVEDAISDYTSCTRNK